MDFIRNYINNIAKLPDESMSKIIGLAKSETFTKGHVFAKNNETPKYFYIIKSGIARSFYTDENGKEHIRTIFTSFATTGAVGALMDKSKSKLTYDCLTDCEMFSFDFHRLKSFMQDDIHLANLYNKVLEHIFKIMEGRIYELSLLNATERYLALKKQIPDIENRIPQYHIASYLNVTPVQLSRIRKEIYSK